MTDEQKDKNIEENERLERERRERDPSDPRSTSTGSTTGNPPGVGPDEKES